jgi:hypothetical protein
MVNLDIITTVIKLIKRRSNQMLYIVKKQITTQYKKSCSTYTGLVTN